MHLNLRHLQIFRDVARLGSVSGAARAAHLSQPAVTQALAGLERHFGATLLERHHRGVSLTRAGGVCLARIERALTQIHDALGERTRDEKDHRVRMRQLDALSAVVQYGNFSAAARARRISQPSVHRAARDLETLLGRPLFERTSFGITPTREAQELARRARLASAELDQARSDLHALAGAESGHTVIGALPLSRSHWLPSALLEFTREHPRHRVTIMDGTYEHLLTALRTGEADFLLGALREPSPGGDLEQQHLFDDPLAVIVRAGHPLARKRRLRASELADFPWIAPREGSPLRRHFDALRAAAGKRLAMPAIECNSLAAGRAFLLESDCVMLLSAQQVHYECLSGQLVALPHPLGNVVRPIGFTMRRDWHPTTTQQRLLALLKSRNRAKPAGRRTA
jgi:LysR family transcriptional regulator of gallate degradation